VARRGRYVMFRITLFFYFYIDFIVYLQFYFCQSMFFVTFLSNNLRDDDEPSKHVNTLCQKNWILFHLSITLASTVRF